MASDDYFERCVTATEQQNLVPVMCRLAMNDIPFRLEQTGGFTMVIVVPREKDTRELWITEEDGSWLVHEAFWNGEDYDDTAKPGADIRFIAEWVV